MRRLQQQIAESLGEHAWGGSRLDEATHLVLRFCYSAAPICDAPFLGAIDHITTAPTIGRVFAHICGGGDVVELTEDLVVVRRFRTPFIHPKIEYHPISKRILGRSMEQEDEDRSRAGVPIVVDDNCSSIPSHIRGFAVDQSTGVLFLRTNTRTVKVVGANNVCVSTIPTRMLEAELYRMFADNGLLVLDHALDFDNRNYISTYDASTCKLLHRFHSNLIAMHLDGRRKLVYLSDHSVARCVSDVVASDLDGKFREKDTAAANNTQPSTFARLSNDVFVYIGIDPFQRTLFMREHL